MAIERRLFWRIAVFIAFATTLASANTSDLRGPHIIKEPQNTTFNLDSNEDSLYLDCEAEGTPRPIYFWQKDEMNLTLTEEVYLTGSSGRLTINEPTQLDHKGMYQCFASNTVGIVMSKPVDLLFAYVNNFLPRNPGPVYTVTEHTGICISCNIPDFYPGVQVSWLRDLFPMFEAQNKWTTHDGRLCFASITKADEGNYVCNVANLVQSGGGGTQKMSGIIEVTVESNSRPETSSPPTVAVSIADRIALQGETVLLECFFYGTPEPTLRWSRKNGELPLKALRNNFNQQLTIPDVEPADAGEYECSASNDIQQNVKISGTLEVKDIYDEVTMECKAESPDGMWYEWYRNTKLFKSRERHTFSDNQQTLHIRNLSRTDTAMYQCIARNEHGFDLSTGQLTVRVPPQWLIPLADVSADIYGEVTMECKAESPDGVWYEWYRNTKLFKSRERHTFSDNQQTLHIRNLSRTDTAMYQCIARNEHGFDLSTGQLTVRAIAPTFIIPLKNNQPAPRKGNITIKCQPDAAPKPTFEWYHGEQPISTGGRFTILDSGDLHISNINDDDGGSYKCVALNSEGTDFSIGSLVVKDGTSIQVKPESKNITVGTDYTLHCSATTDEVFEIAYIWMKGETQIDIVDSDHYEMDGSNLVINDVQLKHAGLYTCVAETTVDADETTAEIGVRGPPGPPANVNAEIVSSTNEVISSTISWNPGADNMSPIIYYKVESRTKYIPEWKEERENIPSSAKHTRISGLSPWSTYQFRVIAQNELGFGEPSEPSAPTVTPKRRPTKAPTNIRGCCGGIDILKIEWDPLNLQDWNAPGLLYIVEYREKDSNPEVFQTVKTTEENVTYAIVEGVPAYTLYVVKVRAKNEVEMGPFSPDADVYSYQELPDTSPTKVTGIASSGSSVKVSWAGIDMSNLKGTLGGYKVKYWPKTETIETAQVHKSPGDGTSTEVMGLTPNTEYKMVVVAVNGDDENGPDSESFGVKTLKSSPLAVPSGLKVVAKDKDSMTVSWSAIKTGNSEEPLKGYKVLYWKEGEFEKNALVKQTSATQVTIDGLDKVTYLVKVRGTSAGGDGPVSETPVKINIGKAEQGASKDKNGNGSSRLADSVSVTFLFVLSLVSFLIQML